MAYDDARGVTILFGGYNLREWLGDTWEWNGSAWTFVSNIGPQRRYHSKMAYDSGRCAAVLFGGYDGSHFGHTWEYSCAETCVPRARRPDKSAAGLMDPDI